MTRNRPAEQLTARDLRIFGLSFGAAIGLVGGLLVPWTIGHAPFAELLLITLIMWVLALAAPWSLKPIYLIWMAISKPLANIIAYFSMALAYFLVIVPAGLIMSLIGRDALNRAFRAEDTSYRIPVEAREKEHFERQF